MPWGLRGIGCKYRAIQSCNVLLINQLIHLKPITLQTILKHFIFYSAYKQPSPPLYMSMSTRSERLVPGACISRQVITADIQRYIGPDATVSLGVGLGEQGKCFGFWIVSHHPLTREMLEDLMRDWERWWRKHPSQDQDAYRARHTSQQHEYACSTNCIKSNNEPILSFPECLERNVRT